MKIFIVEDSALMNARIAQAATRVPGCVVAGSAGGVAEAVDAIRSCEPDALIVDLQLRDGSGLSVLREIHAQCPEMRSVVLSNSSTEPWRRAALKAGALKFLDKSIEFEQLAGILADWHESMAMPTTAVAQ
jgi:DNA-binding NarL/FixJ family response regulator